MARIFLFIFVVSMSPAIQLMCVDSPQKETPRSIVSDDFTNHRPKSRKRGKPSARRSRIYRLASKTLPRPAAQTSSDTLQVGLTIWKLQPVRAAHASVRQFPTENGRQQWEWIARRIEAGAQFHQGDLLRLSIESQRPGYLYVINRDWFTDGTSGETNLIFPTDGEDNQLGAGKLIDIPAGNQAPFRASPKPNQAGEMLTLLITASPLPLRLSKDPVPIASTQLFDWEERWSGLAERFEMNGGAGQARTIEEQQAAGGTRQLTRDDPGPQTIYLVTPKRSDGLIFNVVLSYVR